MCLIELETLEGQGIRPAPHSLLPNTIHMAEGGTESKLQNAQILCHLGERDPWLGKFSSVVDKLDRRLCVRAHIGWLLGTAQLCSGLRCKGK